MKTMGKSEVASKKREISSASVKTLADSMGIKLSDVAAKELADDVSYKLKLIIQNAAEFMDHSKRRRLTTNDVDCSFRTNKVEPELGCLGKYDVTFQGTTDEKRNICFIEEKEIDLKEMIASKLPKFPRTVNLHAHWLAINGVQPTIPENPPPVSRELQKMNAIDPTSNLCKTAKRKRGDSEIPFSGKSKKLKTKERVQVKPMSILDLSLEQQIYYTKITEACVGTDDTKREEALRSLASDPGIHMMLPRLSNFIIEGVRVNVVEQNLAFLIYLMRIIKALLENTSLYLEKYLHELVPSVCTCIVSKQLCIRPESDNHWALRDFAARLLSQICKNFNTPTNNLQTRLTRMFANAIGSNTTDLCSLYGAIKGLSELGPEVIKIFIYPKIQFIGSRMQFVNSQSDIQAVIHIRHIVCKCAVPILKDDWKGPDMLEKYKTDFGFFGPYLHQAVLKANLKTSQQQPPSGTQASYQQTLIQPSWKETPKSHLIIRSVG